MSGLMKSTFAQHMSTFRSDWTQMDGKLHSQFNEGSCAPLTSQSFLDKTECFLPRPQQ